MGGYAPSHQDHGQRDSHGYANGVATSSPGLTAKGGLLWDYVDEDGSNPNGVVAILACTDAHRMWSTIADRAGHNPVGAIDLGRVSTQGSPPPSANPPQAGAGLHNPLGVFDTWWLILPSPQLIARNPRFARAHGCHVCVLRGFLPSHVRPQSTPQPQRTAPWQPRHAMPARRAHESCQGLQSLVVNP